MKKEKGFTLIELMVVMVISITTVLGVGVLGGYWVNNSKALSTQSYFLEGVNKARALALRNLSGVTSDEASIFLVNDKNTLKLCQKEICENVYWQTDLPSKVDIKINNQEFHCLTFNNQGLPINNGNNNCVLAQNYEITSSNIKIEGVF